MSDKKRNSAAKLIVKNKDAYFLAAPFFLLFFVFTVVPMIAAVVFSFFRYDLSGLPEFSGIDNFSSLFMLGGKFTSAAANSLLMFLAVGAGGFVLCFAAAWGLDLLPKKFADVITIILFAISLSGTAATAVWLSGGLLDPLNSFLVGAGFSDVPSEYLSDGRYAFLCVALSQLFTTFGIGFLSLRSGFRAVDREKADAAKIEGIKNPLWILVHSQIPSLYPQMLFAFAVQIPFAFTNGELLRILSGTPAEDLGTYSIMTFIFEQGAELDVGKVCCAEVILLLLMTLIYAAARIIVKKFSKDV